MKITLPSRRLTYLIGFIITSLCVGIPLYLQIHYNINPCPLCILQRITLALLGVVFFFGAVFNFKKVGQFIIGGFACVLAILGMVLAGRQVWLQHFPLSQTSDCGASLQYMLQVLPLTEVLQKTLIGGTECSQIDGKFLSMSLAEWSLICFVLLFILSFWQLCRKKQ